VPAVHTIIETWNVWSCKYALESFSHGAYISGIHVLRLSNFKCWGESHSYINVLNIVAHCIGR
jgi:hypothetical protein